MVFSIRDDILEHGDLILELRNPLIQGSGYFLVLAILIGLVLLQIFPCVVGGFLVTMNCPPKVRLLSLKVFSCVVGGFLVMTNCPPKVCLVIGKRDIHLYQPFIHLVHLGFVLKEYSQYKQTEQVWFKHTGKPTNFRKPSNHPNCLMFL